MEDIALTLTLSRTRERGHTALTVSPAMERERGAAAITCRQMTIS